MLWIIIGAIIIAAFIVYGLPLLWDGEAHDRRVHDIARIEQEYRDELRRLSDEYRDKTRRP